MKTAEALSACEETVRRGDPDRYFATLFAPASRRPLLFALYAFNHDVARIGEQSREPMMGAIRLQWWRETVEQAREGRPRMHPVAIGLAALCAEAAPVSSFLEMLLDAREFDVTSDTFADVEALESYCERTSSGLMRIADCVLGGRAGAETCLRHAGIAYALAGLLRAIPFHAARRRLYLPLAFLTQEDVSPDEIFAGRTAPSLNRVIRRLAERARDHLAAARGFRPGRSIVAALPAALVPVYLQRVARKNFHPFRDSSEVALFRRQMTLLRAATFGRL